jgi:hypothetical protein
MPVSGGVFCCRARQRHDRCSTPWPAAKHSDCCVAARTRMAKRALQPVLVVFLRRVKRHSAVFSKRGGHNCDDNRVCLRHAPRSGCTRHHRGSGVRRACAERLQHVCCEHDSVSGGGNDGDPDEHRTRVFDRNLTVTDNPGWLDVFAGDIRFARFGAIRCAFCGAFRSAYCCII